MTTPAPVPSSLREYDVAAKSTDVFGRVLCSARTHHIVVDGPVQNGCPGEELTPAEVFLLAVAACGVELIQVIAKDEGIAIERVDIQIHGIVDRGNQAREDVTLFNHVALDVAIAGATQTQAAGLVNGFRRRCPLYGTVSVAAGKTVVTVRGTA